VCILQFQSRHHFAPGLISRRFSPGIGWTPDQRNLGDCAAHRGADHYATFPPNFADSTSRIHFGQVVPTVPAYAVEGKKLRPESVLTKPGLRILRRNSWTS
jgi:hypothetical protein